MLAGFSDAMTPANACPSFVSMFHAVKDGSTSAFGSTMALSNSEAACAPMPVRPGPMSMPASPNLWQIAHVTVNAALPFAASPGCSTAGSSFAMASFFAFASGFNSSSICVARLLTARSGCVRRRAALAGPSFVTSTCLPDTASRKASAHSGRFSSVSKATVCASAESLP